MKFFLFLFLFNSFKAIGQISSIKANNDFDFVINKIKTSYAGYKEKSKIIDLDILIKEINLKKYSDTFEKLSKITLPFNDHHLRLFEDISFDKINKNDCITNLALFGNDLSKKKLKKYEGYWINHLNNIIIYLKQDSFYGFNGFLVESKKNIPKGYCILKMAESKNGRYTTDYINILNKVRTFLYSTFKNDNSLSCNSYVRWKKIDNYQNDYLSKVSEITKMPSINIDDINNVVIKMPTFNSNKRKIYDSLITANKNFINNSKCLIVDLRNNSGGVINCFYSLLPFVCTKTMMRLEMYQLVSEDVIEDIRSKRKEVLGEKDTAMLARYEKYLKSFEDIKDSFKFILSDTLISCDNKPENNIKNIALIINDRCLSAAEYMILAFKQSSKVKIFGEYSGGAIDYVDVKEYELPQSKFILWVARTKRKISKDYPAYDFNGIKPDIEIKLEEAKWLNFVKKYYEKN